MRAVTSLVSTTGNGIESSASKDIEKKNFSPLRATGVGPGYGRGAGGGRVHLLPAAV